MIRQMWQMMKQMKGQCDKATTAAQLATDAAKKVTRDIKCVKEEKLYQGAFNVYYEEMLGKNCSIWVL